MDTPRRPATARAAGPAGGGGALLARVRALAGRGRHVRTLVTGTVLAQGLTVLASPVLTRLYGPADFGALAVYTSLAGTLSVVVCLKYDAAINVSADDAEAANVLTLSLLAGLATSALAAAAVLLLREDVAAAVRAPRLARYLWLLPLTLLGLALYQALVYWAVRRDEYPRIARTKVTQALLQVLVQLGLGLAGRVPAGLFVGDAVSRLGGLGTLARMSWRRDRALFAGAVSWSGMARAARRYRRFPLVSSGSSLLNILAVAVPVFFLATHYSTRVTGDFSLVQRLLDLPTSLLGQAVGLYYVGQGSTLLRTRPAEARRFFLRTVVRLALLVGLPLALVGLLGPRLVPWVFGAAWHEAGRYAMVVAWGAAIRTVALPVAQTLVLLERQELQLAWDAGRLLLVVGALWTAAALGAPPLVAVGTYSVTMGLSYLALLVLCARALKAAPARATPEGRSRAPTGS